MKKSLMLLLSVTAWLATGCGSSEEAAAPATNSNAGGNPLTAPVDYLGAVGKAQQSVTKKASTLGLTQAIQLFQVQEERLPKNLQELVPNYIPKLPSPPAHMKFDYNPATGQLKLVPE